MTTILASRRTLLLSVLLALLAAALACGPIGGSTTAPPPPPPEQPQTEQQPAEPAPTEEQVAQSTGTVPLSLVNDSSVEVCYVYISPTTSDTWGDDWLGANETIPPSSTRAFDVPAGTYDLKADDCSQAELGVQMGVDVTDATDWTFTGGDFFYDDFSTEDPTTWEVFNAPGYGFGGVVDGEYVLGPFEECADIGGGSATPFACFSQCLGCGTLSTYDMAVNARYLDGLADRSFGLVLRFVDLNGDGLVDPADYFLDFEIAVYDQSYVVWEHDTNGNWNNVTNGYSDIIQTSRSTNNLRAVAYNGGSDIDLYVNGLLIDSLTGVPYSDGTVGMAIGFRGVKIGFDDFTLSGT